MNRTLKISLFAIAGLTIMGCGDDNQTPITNSFVTKKEIVANYADIAYANYKLAYDDAVVLEAAINTFTTTPTEENFTAAKESWKTARESYGTTEAFRFANGPIDDETNNNAPEALMNAWPLDENYIDYTDNNGSIVNGGIINETVLYPTLTKELLESLNEDGSEKNISTGYHAIEFLLWGQDLTAPSDNLPGQRLYTDFIDGGTALNAARRSAYLNICADLLTDHLDYLVNQWQEDGEYRAVFLALNDDVALKNIYLGITTLISAELPVERMEVALENADQEDEHSCFSDNTHRDILLNLQGVINVYQGKFGVIEGASLQQLINLVDPAVGQATNESLAASLTKANAIMNPFDMAISGGPTSTEGAKVKDAALQFKDFGSNLLAGASKLGINVNN